MAQGRFLTGSTMGHVVRMTATGAFGIMFVFLVDAANLDRLDPLAVQLMTEILSQSLADVGPISG